MKDKAVPKKAVLSKFDQDVISMLKKLQHQIDAVERKANILLKSSKPKIYKEGNFSKEPRGFHKSNRNFKDKKEGVSDDGKFYHGRPFSHTKDTGKNNFRTKNK